MANKQNGALWVRGISKLLCAGGFVAMLLGAGTNDARDEFQSAYEETKDEQYNDLLEQTADSKTADIMMFSGLAALGLGVLGLKKTKNAASR